MGTSIKHHFTTGARDNLTRPLQVVSSTGSTIGKGKENLQDAYIHLAELLLNRQIERKLLTPDQMDKVELEFDFKTMVASYQESGGLREIDLLPLMEKNNEIKEAIKECYDLVHPGKWESKLTKLKEEMKAHYKGKLNGEAPLQRTTKHLENLPKDFNAVAPKLQRLPNAEARKIVAERLHNIEYNFLKLHDGLTAMLKERIDSTKDADEKVARRLNSEINALTSLRDYLRETDIDTLTSVACEYPTGSRGLPLDSQELEAILQNKLADVRAQLEKARAEDDGKYQAKEKISKLQKQVQKLTELKDNIASTDFYRLVLELSEYPMEDPILRELAPYRHLVMDAYAAIKGDHSYWERFEKEGLSTEEIEYIKDRLGMLFIGRSSYAAFCKQNGIKMKKESMGDVLLRIALFFRSNYTKDAWMDHNLLDDLPETLHEEVIKLFRQIEEGSEAAIPKDGVYADTEKLQEEFEAQRKKINRDAPLPDAPKKLQVTKVETDSMAPEVKMDASPYRIEEGNLKDEPITDVISSSDVSTTDDSISISEPKAKSWLSTRNLAIGAGAIGLGAAALYAGEISDVALPALKGISSWASTELSEALPSISSGLTWLSNEMIDLSAVTDLARAALSSKLALPVIASVLLTS